MAGVVDSRRWSVLAADARAERALVDTLGVPELVARVLVARGITDVDEAREFLTPSLARDWADPLCIPGMERAVDRVELAVSRHEVIAVFGDFDVDGMSSTSLLTLALRRLGATVHPYIPHRFGEGYGLSREALDRVVTDCHPDVIITVDNGIASAREVEWVLSQGVDVVVTDHHEPADLVPHDVPVTDPKLVCECPSRELAGAGVALKLVCELGRRLGVPDLWLDYIDLATLGTLSDMMQLVGENRALVSEGIRRMRLGTRPGIVALAATANLDVSELSADNLPFSLIPRLNAAGRMGDVEVALDLLLTDDPAEAVVLAGKLEEINSVRRETESLLTEAAMEKVRQTYRGGRAIVVGGEGWHEGVKGIVASRIVNRYHVPAIIFTITEDGLARGSGRSVGSVDLFHAVEQCSDLLVRFGGHAGAVGVTCEASKLDAFRERLEDVLGQLPAEQFVDTGEVTALVDLGELTVESIDGLDVLQPYGQGNKKPLFAACGVSMRNRARVGTDAAHLRFVATNGVSSVPAIMFRVPDVARSSTWDGAVDLVFEAVNETWQGRTKPKLMVKDIIYRVSEASVAPSLADEVLAHASDPAVSLDEPDAAARSCRRYLAALGEEALTDELRRRMIGESPLLTAQEAALERLARSRSCLCVMATGRGKSLIFHIHAAREALLHNRASIFVYPLRALVSDQAFHLAAALAPLGVTVEVLTGETEQDERDRVFSALASGAADVVLTTPEFLAIHAGRFAQSRRVGFLVIDEAHHAGLSKSGNRSAYGSLPEILEELGHPTTLAVTATAATDVAAEVCRLASIDVSDVICDVAVRENLVLDDCRELRDREAALVSIVASGEKCVVYVSSRDQAESLVRMLRHRVPELAARIAFYHAGLSRNLRGRVERAFRVGELSCIVSTSAFGEGVNLPDIRHVVLYGLPYGEVEFNQMSGRAGRDGLPACVHLLFGARDVRVNERVLASSAPGREELVSIYRTLVSLSRAHASLALTDAAIADAVLAANARMSIGEAEVSSGIAVFSELGFLSQTGWGESRRIEMAARPAHMELTQSVRYVEGQRQREAFSDFCAWVLSASAEELIAHINRPIVPDFGTVIQDGREDSHDS